MLFLLTFVNYEQIGTLNSNIAKVVKVDNIYNMSSYAGAEALISAISGAGISVYVASCTGGNRLPDLPIIQAGTYIVIPATFYIKIIFLGTNGTIYVYVAGEGWKQVGT
jgi:hypothetical protein